MAARLCPLLFVAVLVGCDDPQGIVKIHFSLRAPRVVELGDDAGPAPIDLVAASHATGTVEIFADIGHLSVALLGLPPTADPALTYAFWLSDSESGGGWVAIDEVVPQATGAGAVHHDQVDVSIDLPTVRSALLTLGAPDSAEPSHLVVLGGGVGQDPEPAATGAAPTGHTHEH